MTVDFSFKNKRVWVAGHKGMVGQALVRRLWQEDCEIQTVDRTEVDLITQKSVENWVQENKPDVVIIAAAKVGGIHANNVYPAQFLYDNLMIASNIIHAAHQVGVEKLLFLGSSCIYPRHATQPMTEKCLLEGALEPTNQWYAVAKIAGLKLVEAYNLQYGSPFISAMPTNLFGEGDTYHLENSHVLPALIMKIDQAKKENQKQVKLWGSGRALREFLYVDDLADACIFLLKKYTQAAPINVGVGKDLTILDLAKYIAKIIGYEGDFVFDASKPDGTPQKLLDVSKISQMGWFPKVNLEDGIRKSYEDYQRRFG